MYHTYLTIVVPAIISFAVTIAATLFLMRYMSECGVTAVDVNKKIKLVLPCGFGAALAIGFVVGTLAYSFGGAFSLYPLAADLKYIFATALAVMLIAFVGFLDDLNVKAKPTFATGMMNTRKGLKQWQKPLLTLIGALPLMAVNAGISTISIPFIGAVNFGILYPLLILPLAIIFAANSFNLLGGFNAIESGSGFILAVALLVYSIIFGSFTGALISSILAASILAIMLFNIYPAKLIPGDGFTYGVGAAFVAAIVLGNMEAFGLIIFIPWIVEFFLHLRGKFHVTDLGTMRKDGTFAAPYGKRVYSWTHIIMNAKRCKEWEVSLYMWCITLCFVALGFALSFFKLL